MRAAAALPIEAEIDERTAGIPDDFAGGLDRLTRHHLVWPFEGTGLAGGCRMREDVSVAVGRASAQPLDGRRSSSTGPHRPAPCANLTGMGRSVRWSHDVGHYVVQRCRRMRSRFDRPQGRFCRLSLRA